jgi:hypothetical protein
VFTKDDMIYDVKTEQSMDFQEKEKNGSWFFIHSLFQQYFKAPSQSFSFEF